MSSPPPKPRPLPNLHAGLINSIVDKMVPLFSGPNIDRLHAGKMAIVAIDAYCPEDRADYVNVARIIAFSMAALQLLGTAAASAEDLPMTEKMRLFGRAIALNRSADQSERTMMQRRRYRSANPRPADPAPLPEPPIQDHEYDAPALQAAIAEATGQPAPRPAPPRTATITPVLPHALSPAARPVSAISHPHAYPASLKASLLAQAAMPVPSRQSPPGSVLV